MASSDSGESEDAHLKGKTDDSQDPGDNHSKRYLKVHGVSQCFFYLTFVMNIITFSVFMVMLVSGRSLEDGKDYLYASVYATVFFFTSLGLFTSWKVDQSARLILAEKENQFHYDMEDIITKRGRGGPSLEKEEPTTTSGAKPAGDEYDYTWVTRRMIYIGVPLSFTIPTALVSKNLIQATPLSTDVVSFGFHSLLVILGEVGFVLSGSSIVLKSLWRPNTLCYTILKDFIEGLQCEMKQGKVDWDLKTDELQVIDHTFETVYQIFHRSINEDNSQEEKHKEEQGSFCASAMVCVTLFGAAAIGLPGVVILLHELLANQVYAMMGLGFTMFFAAIAFSAVTMKPLAELTAKCHDKRERSGSILSTAWRCHLDRDEKLHMSESERAAQNRFVYFVESNLMGVEIEGVLISWSLIWSLLIKLGLVAPTIFAVLQKVLSKVDSGTKAE